MNKRKVSYLLTTCMISCPMTMQTVQAEYFRMPLSMFVIGERSISSNPHTPVEGESGGNLSALSLSSASPFEFYFSSPITPIDFSRYLAGDIDPNHTVSYRIKGDIPSGLIFSGSTLSGTSLQVGNYDIEVTATSNGKIASQNYHLVVNGLNLNIKDLSVGASHACISTDVGDVWCWGDRLSIGTAQNQKIPFYTGRTNASHVSGGRGNYSCMVTLEVNISCWGTSAEYLKSSRSVGDRIKSIGSGVNHGCVLTVGGKVYCWGKNEYGQLALAKISTASIYPNLINGLYDVVSLSSGANHNCALINNGDIKCWGINLNGETGSNNYSGNNYDIVLVGNIPDAKKIISGDNHSCVITESGKIYCWGKGQYGRLGNAQTSDKTTPTLVSNSLIFKDVAAGSAHTCAVSHDNNMYCWGYGAYGATTYSSNISSPRLLSNLAGQYTGVFAGGNTSCATTYSGLYCWGRNDVGQSGAGVDNSIQGNPLKVNVTQ